MTDWTPADTLSPEAAAWWDALLAELRSRGRLDVTPPFYVRMLAQFLAQWDRVTQFLQREGMVLEIRNDKGELKRQEPAPEFRIQQQLSTQILAYAKRCGLDAPPSEPAPAASPRNRLAELLGALNRG